MLETKDGELMRSIDDSEANALLSRIGMKVGAWGQVCDAADRLYLQSEWFNYRAPTTAHELYGFAEHVARWIPRGDWKIFRIDNSTSLLPEQAFFVWRLLFGHNNYDDWLRHRTFCFEFVNEVEDSNEDMLLCHLIYLFLLFEAHCQVVSSGCEDGKSLSLQDGYAYFRSRNKADLLEARSLLQTFEEGPLLRPWLLE